MADFSFPGNLHVCGITCDLISPMDAGCNPQMSQKQKHIHQTQRKEHELAEHLLTVRDPKQRQILIKRRPSDQKPATKKN